MIEIPAGDFVMGSSDEDLQLTLQECNQTEGNCQPDWFASEQPVRTVFVDGFSISQFEVTNAQYNLCVAHQVCPPVGRLPADTDIPYKAGFFANSLPAENTSTTPALAARNMEFLSVVLAGDPPSEMLMTRALLATARSMPRAMSLSLCEQPTLGSGLVQLPGVSVRATSNVAPNAMPCVIESFFAPSRILDTAVP